jgi:DNA-binding CsgD family transcriptional regulator
LFRVLDETALIGIGLAGLGELAIRQQHLERANDLLEESLTLRRELGERWGIAVSLGSLGWAALLQRNFERMRAMMEESLAIRMEIGDIGGTAWCFEKLAEATILQAQALPAPYSRQALRRAGQIFGAAAALRASLNSVIDPADQPQHDRILRELRRALSGAVLDAAWGEGAKMPVQTVVALALAPVLLPADSASLSSRQAAKGKYGGLTGRERKTAVLIAQGKTNREIAEIMIVRVKTVETYVTRILNKLGFDSRVQIATWAIGVGLTDKEPDNGN